MAYYSLLSRPIAPSMLPGGATSCPLSLIVKTVLPSAQSSDPSAGGPVPFLSSSSAAPFAVFASRSSCDREGRHSISLSAPHVVAGL
jgi:hypothetical protein